MLLLHLFEGKKKQRLTTVKVRHMHIYSFYCIKHFKGNLKY